MENKYQDPRYRKRVREWIQSLRAGDRKLQHEQEFRDNILRGGLASAGAFGLAPGVPKPVWDTKVTENLCDDHAKQSEGSL